MSVERVVLKDGSAVWRVRWRQAGRNRSTELGRKRDADAFNAEIVRRKRTGDLARLDAGKEPLAEFGEESWRLHAEPNLARSTLKGYASIWDAHVLLRRGSVPLRELRPDVVNRFRLELEADGVGPTSIRKALGPASGRPAARLRVGPPGIEPGRDRAQAGSAAEADDRAAGTRARRGDPLRVARLRTHLG